MIRDILLRMAPASAVQKVAVVAVDEAALREMGPWPWDRDRLAQLVESVYGAGARGVALDVLLPEARPGDPRLARALAQGPSVLAVGVDDGGRWLWPDSHLQEGEKAHVSFDLDRDGVIRRFTSTRQIEGRILPAFPVAAARLGDPRLAIPVDQVLQPGFRARAVPVVSAAEVLQGKRVQALQDRVVFIGTTAAGLGDRVVTPVSDSGRPQPGVLVEAQATEAFIAGDLLRPIPPMLQAAAVFGLAWLGTWVLSANRRHLVALVPGLVLAPSLLAAFSLRGFHLVWAPGAMTLSLVLAGAMITWARFREARRTARDSEHRIAELEGLQRALTETGKQEAEARRVVAHELKTPLTSVRGLAQLLAQYDLSSEERTRVAGMVVSEASRLAQMVDALLDLERLRLRDPAKEARPLDLSALCRERTAFLQAGTERPITRAVEEGLRVAGDPSLLARVVENLVSNALKFSPDRTPVRLVLRREGAEAVLEVEDRGPGVPVEERTRIFGRFARGSTRGEAPGLGLGLALVAEVAAWHQGRVEVDDGTGGGSCFRVRLPLASAD